MQGLPAFLLILLSIVPGIAFEESSASGQTAVKASGLTLEELIKSLDPPTVDEIIESLQPIPTIEKCLTPVFSDPNLPWKRTLTGEDKARVEELESQALQSQEQGDFKKAGLLAGEAFTIRQRIQGGDHWITVDAKWMVKTCRLIDALPVESRAELTLAKDKNKEADRFKKQNKYTQSVLLNLESLAIYRRLLGNEHPRVATSLNILGFLTYSNGDFAGAEILCRGSLALRQKIYANEHPEVAANLSNLAWLLYSRGDYSKSEALWCKSLELRRRIFGNEHPDVAASLSSLAGLLRLKRDYAVAEPLYRESLAISRKLLGDEHQQVATCLNDLALLLDSKKDYAGAEPLYRESLTIYRKLLGDDHPYVAASLNNLADLLRARGDYIDAESLYRESLAISRKLWNNEHPQVATSLNNLALLLHSKRDYSGAESLFRESLAIRRKLFGNGHPHVAQSLNNLAGLLGTKRDYAGAELLYRDSLAIYRKILGDVHPEVAATLNDLGSVLQSNGDYTAAESAYCEALDIRRQYFGNEHPHIATSLNKLAALLDLKGNYTDAEPLFREALDITRRLFGNEHAEVASILNNLAVLLKGKGDYAGAEPPYRESLAIYRKLYGDEHRQTAVSLNNLAEMLRSQGDLAGAEPLYRKALDIKRRLFGDEHTEIAYILNNLAVLLKAKGDYAGAEPLFREALAMRRKLLGGDHLDVGASLCNLALLLKAKEDFAGAELHYRESLAICRKRVGSTHPHVATILLCLAGLLDSQGDHAGAEPLYRESLAIYRELFKDEHPDLAMCLANLAGFLHAKGDSITAEAYYHESLAIRRKLLRNNHPDVAHSLKNLALLLYIKGDYAGAEPLYRETLAILDSERTRLVGGERDRAQYAEELDLPGTTAWLSVTLLRLGRTKEAVDIFECGRGRALLDLLTRDDRDLAEEVQRCGDNRLAMELQRLLKEESSARIAVTGAENTLAATRKRQDLRGDEKGKIIDDLDESVKQARLKLRDAEAAVLTTFRDAWPDAKPAGVEEIRSRLCTDEIILCYTWTPGALTLLVVPHMTKGEVQGVLLGEGKEDIEHLTRLVDESRASLAKGIVSTEQHDLEKRLHELYKRLIGGLPREISRLIFDARRIIVLPSGPLTGIPFEALVASKPSSKNTRYLLDEIPQVVYAESATIYINRGKERANKQASRTKELTAVILGKPIFHHDKNPAKDPGKKILEILHSRGEEAAVAEISALDQIRLHGGVLRELPASGREARSIARIIRASGGNPTLLLDDQATLGNLEAAVPAKRFVHLATHGLTGSRERPYDASLALTQPGTPTPDDIGFLTLDRLIRKWRGKLEECELVVLSACDTQRGIKAGGSVMALPWGFMYAGAPTVVATLWRVNDTAAALLMQRFYENLLGQYSRTRGGHRPGHPMHKANALREAKQWLRSLTTAEAEKLTRGEVEESELSISQQPHHPFAHPCFWAAFILIGNPE